MSEDPAPIKDHGQGDLPPKMQRVPLTCPGCTQSAYLVDAALALRTQTMTRDMLTRTDDRALEPHDGMGLQCPYCGHPLAIAMIFPVVGGGWEIRFRWLAAIAETT